ncbi:MAG: alpha/beta fold hydrolase [Planctomycetota bacterium]
MSDGYLLRGRVWPGRSPTRAVVLYLHGIQSHGGWFEWSASLLAEAGCTVVLPDRRGSGMNDAARGDTPSYQRWLSDLDELADWAGQRWKTDVVDLVGVSWGGKLAATWAHLRSERVRRQLLIAPGLFPAVDIRPWAKIGVGLSLLVGGQHYFDIPLSAAALFTENPAGRAFIESDPHKLTRTTGRFLWNSRKLDRILAGIARRELSTPTSLLLAGRDRIIQNTPTVTWIRRVAIQTPEVIELSDYSHTLEFAQDASAFAAQLQHWVAI